MPCACTPRLQVVGQGVLLMCYGYKNVVTLESTSRASLDHRYIQSPFILGLIGSIIHRSCSIDQSIILEYLCTEPR